MVTTRSRVLLCSAGAAAATVALLLWRRRKKEEEDNTTIISTRGERMNMPALPYIGGVIEGFTEPFDAATGKGVILMAVAENKLCWDMLKPRFARALQDMPDWVANYGPMSGQMALRDPLAAFMRKHMMTPRKKSKKKQQRHQIREGRAAEGEEAVAFPTGEQLVCATALRPEILAQARSVGFFFF